MIEKPLNSVNSLVDLTFTLQQEEGLTMLLITGEVMVRKNRRTNLKPTTTWNKQHTNTKTNNTNNNKRSVLRRCVGVGVREGSTGDEVLVTNLTLPHGHYNVTVYLESGSLSGKRYDWDETRSIGRRDVSDTASLVLSDPGSDMFNSSMCFNCYTLSKDYKHNTATLYLYYTVNTSCHHNCSAVRVQLYKHEKNNISKEECDSLEMENLYDMPAFGTDKNITKGLRTYNNVDKGCYSFKVTSLVSNWPERMGPFWLLHNTTIIDMNTWNTTFLIEPNPETQSLSVRWNNMPLYDFTKYKLELWHGNISSLSCVDENPHSVNVCTQDEEELFVYKSYYKFVNLTVGWYCVQITPFDDRCPLDGCVPLSSPTIQLTNASLPDCHQSNNCDTWPTSVVVVVVLAGVVGVIVLGVTLACCVIRCRPALGGGHSVGYARVPLMSVRKVLRKQQKVLVVWSPCGKYGEYFGPVVTAFKRILQSYAHCQVYDYLDMLSLPDNERRHLLAYPIAWIDSLLLRPDVKVIIVATAGARQRQAENLLATPPATKHCLTHSIPPLDPMLFPYILRRLQDTPNLAMDYSRVFHVRFSDVSDIRAELDGIVSWTRYRLPQHLPALAYSLQGGRYLGGSKFEEPTPEVLCELHKALTNHPEYQPHTNSTSPNTDIFTSSRPYTLKTNVTNGGVKDLVTSNQNDTIHSQKNEPDSPA
ncbi:hypothetical protein Pmani_002193 [Petrolisthes manimaculis]|uniref:SEFIR domain-containing protein n=1 Tax=Petrolisthes manimaculis TaxID=1843537 RepID=A0AAE1UQQ8_9EUCA|nr:hypothetical protein Pmani_002193 [Petrolisthes manimaculis]